MKTNNYRPRGLALLASAALWLQAAPALTANLTLEHCIKTGLTNSPDIRAASFRLRASASAVAAAESAFYPWLTASSILTRTDNPPQAFMMALNQRVLDMRAPTFDPNNPDTTDNLRGSIGIQYRLLDGGRARLDHKMAKLSTSAAGEILDSVRNELIHQITKAYYAAAKAKTFISVQEEAVKSAGESLRVATERHKAGVALDTDVLNLQVQLAQASEDLVRARNGLLMAIAALNTAIGSNTATAECIPSDAAEIPAITPPPNKTEPSTAENRPEYKAMSIMSSIREKSLQKARREYSPTLSLFASSDWDSEVSGSFEQSYMAGVMAELNLFDGFRTRSSIKEADAQAKAAAADREKVLNQLKLDLTQATLEVKEAAERMEVTGKGANSAAQALRITRDRYQNGACSAADLIQAQTAATAMKARDAAARYDYLTALSNLERAKGGLTAKYGRD